MVTGDLFNYPNAAGFKERDSTSERAAKEIEASGRAQTLRIKLLKLFHGGWQGTADEAASEIKATPFSVRPRISELRLQGFLQSCGEKHGRYGKSVHIWRMARQ